MAHLAINVANLDESNKKKDYRRITSVENTQLVSDRSNISDRLSVGSDHSVYSNASRCSQASRNRKKKRGRRASKMAKKLLTVEDPQT